MYPRKTPYLAGEKSQKEAKEGRWGDEETRRKESEKEGEQSNIDTTSVGEGNLPGREKPL